MEITRRGAIELLAATPVAMAQTPAGIEPVALSWLDGAPPETAAGVAWGVPFRRGAVRREQTFRLSTTDGRALPLQSWPLAYWPDGSMKFLGFATVADAGASAPLRLSHDAPGAPVGPAVRVTSFAQAVEIDTGALQCRIAAAGASIVESMTMEGRVVAREGRLVCTLEDRTQAAGGVIRYEDFRSQVRKVAVEQSGPVRAVVRIEGVHRAVKGAREWLPFVVRLYFHAGLARVRMIHTIVFDGDDRRDFIRGLGVAFTVPMREQIHNRHVRFSGEDAGLWAEPVQPATGRRRITMPGRANLYADQLAGARLPNREEFPAAGQ